MRTRMVQNVSTFVKRLKISKLLSQPDMKATTDLYEVIYLSTLAPDVSVSVVADITRKAREGNAARNISGLLIFDGLRFCEQVEGAKKDIVALIDRVRHDPRHIKFEILHHGALNNRRFSNFSMGYAEVEDPDVLSQLALLRGQEALDALTALLPTLDLYA